MFDIFTTDIKCFRSGSITEDGVTTRFREDSREDSLSRDSGISSIREGSVYDYPRRFVKLDSFSKKCLVELKIYRSERRSKPDLIESVAELRNKYSPANYVPAIYRNKYDNISRSKSINDIGKLFCLSFDCDKVNRARPID